MSQQTTIRTLAELVNTPVEKLLKQLAEAGMTFSGPDQTVTSAEKLKLLGFLKRSHGKNEAAAEDPAAPKKITLNRNRKQEITVGGGKNRQTVDVVVRKKVTLVKHDGVQSPGDERAEILRKLEESRQRNLDEQQRLAEDDRKRAEEIAERKRAVEAAAARVAAEAAAAVAAASGTPEKGEETTAVARPAKTGGHGHGHPKPVRTEPARVDDRNAHKNKPNRGSHVMVTEVEDDDSTARFAGQLHLSPTERERRSTARSKPKAKRQLEQSRSGGGQHGFTRPTEKVVREVAIGDAITVSDLAQKLALKGGDVVKALFKMGVMATITQTIDHDTAALVVEELGHKPVRADSGDAEVELLAHIEDQQGEKKSRPPVVTIMGHVDHG
jgi:translation initiation factor IF-2